MTTEAKNEKPPERIVEARLRLTYTNPESGHEEFHPRANFKRNRHGEPEEIDGKRTLIGGSQVFSTGPGGGPSVELNFTDWTKLPNGPGGVHVARYFLADPVERARVELRSRPNEVKTDDLMKDPGIRHLSSEEYAREHARDMSARRGIEADQVDVPSRKRGAAKRAA